MPIALATLAAALCACSSPAPQAATTTTTVPPTTLPVPVTLTGTSPQGSYASLGPIERIPAPILAKGTAAPPASEPLLPYSAGSVRVGFRQFGSGPALLLVMGQHGTMTWWDPQLLTDLAAHFTVTIFDLPGAGYSAALAGSPTVESYADVAAGLVYSLQLKKPVALGWGLGGAVVLALAERHPSSVGRLVLVDSMVGGSRALGVPPAAAAVLASPTVTAGTVASLMFPATEPGARQAWLARVFQVSPDDIVASGVRSEASAAASLAGDRALGAGLGGIRSAALVIDGLADGVVPAADSTRLAMLLPKRKLDLVAGGGYAVLAEDEGALVSAIVTFAQSG
ncbi:MAG TPA: alpha/beta hydrolase [Acidimicrobiales bacterium]|nr:alpha/beta hydrolase [Acidimicrobiales bacterium]